MNWVSTLRERADQTPIATPSARVDKYIVFSDYHGYWEYVLSPLGHLSSFNAMVSNFSYSFASDWVALGVSYHHWRQRFYTFWAQAFSNPAVLESGYLWDVDHGTVRCWGNRIVSAQIWSAERISKFIETQGNRATQKRFNDYNERIRQELLELGELATQFIGG